MPGAQIDASLPLIQPHALWLARLRRVRGARRRDFEPGQVLLWEGGPPDALGLIETGAVALWSTAWSGRVATLSILGPGDVFGHSPLGAVATQLLPGAGTVARSTILVVPSGPLEASVDEDPVLARGFAVKLAEQLDHIQRSLAEALVLSVRDRVRSALRRLALRHGRPVDGVTLIDLPVSQELLGTMVGATRESVNRALRELRQSGEIQIVDGVYVLMASNDQPPGAGPS